MKVNNKSGFIGIVSLLVMAAIMCTVFYFAMNAYYKSSSIDKETKQAIEQQHIDTTSYKSVLESTTAQIKQIEQLHWQKAVEMDNYRGEDLAP